jgi:hypothetical protein
LKLAKDRTQLENNKAAILEGIRTPSTREDELYNRGAGRGISSLPNIGGTLELA